MNDDEMAQVKSWVADPSRGPLLHDLIHREVAAIGDRMSAADFGAGAPYSDDEFRRRVEMSEDMSAAVVRCSALGGYWSHPAMRPLWPSVVTHLANRLQRLNGVVQWLSLTLYPALLAFYAGGVSATAANRYDTLASLFTEAFVYHHDEPQEAVICLHPHAVIENAFAHLLPGLERRHTATSDRLAAVLRPALAGVIPIDAEFERHFDRFEYLLGLVCYDIRKAQGHPSAPIGRFAWRRIGSHFADDEIGKEMRSQGTQWGPLANGLFAGAVDRVTASTAEFTDRIATARRRWL